MNKVVLKTALITIAALAAAALIVFSMWLVISPQTMATSCEKTGNYSFAVTCADLRYKYTGDAGDLARCAEDGILSGKDKHILNYCEKLTLHDDFGKICAAKDEALSGGVYGEHTGEYRAYIFGHLAAAQYRAGDTDKAVSSAKAGGELAYVKPVIEISERADKSAAVKFLSALREEDQTERVKNLIDILEKIA